MKARRLRFAVLVIGAMAANTLFAGQSPAAKVASPTTGYGKSALPSGGGNGSSSISGTTMRTGGFSAGINGTAVRPAGSSLNGSTIRGRH